MIPLSNITLVTFTIRLNTKSADKVIPSWVRREGLETTPQVIAWESHKLSPNGEKVVESEARTRILPVVPCLASAGYRLADASYRQLRDEHQKTGVLKLVFALGAKQRYMPEKEQEIANDLWRLFTDNLWQAEVYRNPHFVKGEEMPHTECINICLNQREPTLRPDGTDVTEWQKDEEGNRVGDAPRPIMPKRTISFGSDELIVQAV